MFDQPVKRSRSGLTAYPARTIIVSFLVVILVGGILLMLPISSREGAFTPLADAMFTATSATCVTGLVVYDTYLYWSPFGQTVILALIQIGGLGLVTMATSFNILIGRRMGLRSMDLVKESINTDSFDQVKQLVKTIIIGTFLVESVGALLLSFTFVPRFGFQEGMAVSVFTAISAFCNAGFDLMGRYGAYSSLTTEVTNWAVLGPVCLLIILGGLGFVVWEDLLRYRKRHTLGLHTRIVLVMTGLLLAVGTVGFLVFDWGNPETMGPLSIPGKMGAAFFQSVTCRTAGFNTVDLQALTDQSKILSIILMFIGAAPAGTGGGIKVTAIAVLVMTIYCVMRGNDDTVISGHTVDRKAVYKSLALLVLALCLVALSSFVMHFGTDQGTPVIDVVFEEVSAFATVGLSAGVTERLGQATRLVLMLNMFLGRVGPISLITSLAMRPPKPREVLPTARIIIG